MEHEANETLLNFFKALSNQLKIGAAGWGEYTVEQLAEIRACAPPFHPYPG
jgi:hypothetical protein